MNTLPAMASGAVGAIALNLIHESARQIVPQAPQVQKVAMRAIARSMRGFGKRPPGKKMLYRWATAGDLVSNALYYSMIGVGRTKHPWRYRHKDWNMNKKLISTILLFAVFIGFLWWGLAMLFSPGKDVETVIYSLLLLVCAGYALVSLLMLPRKKLP